MNEYSFRLEQREKAKAAEGGGEIFFMRDVGDLSGKDGDLLLMEYSEEHPILLSQPGMASRIRNYHKRKSAKDADPQLDFGELAFAHNSPFLGQVSPGQTLQSLENNLFRAPIHRHKGSRRDFLLIRTKQGYFIRRCPPLFLVGQQSPLFEVPSPNSKRATLFVRDFLMAFIYRLFWASNETPRRLKMEDIKAAFPHYAESSVRKRLKVCSDFKRLGAGMDQNYWILRSDFRLPTKEEVLAMVTPEMCCAQYSMLAAEQRLKDAGYGEKYFFTPEEGDDDDDQVTMEDEIKCAPWNTSRAFLSALKGKCLLDQSGIADPTGGGLGFSFVRVSSKPHKEDVPQVPKRLVTGTNADLRKLPLKEAKEMCRDYGVREEEINALSRWEIIDVIRTLSTQAAKNKKEGEGGGGIGGGGGGGGGGSASMARFARGNIRFNLADMQEKYKKHCQHIFDLQNSVLANGEELSTDEGSSGEESDNEELANRLESMLSAAKGKKGISGERERMEREDEEKERRDLKRMLYGENIKGEAKTDPSEMEMKFAENSGKDIADSAAKISGLKANQKLKIFRTYQNSDGSESTRVEVITRPQLIEAYTRIRVTKDDTFIQVYAQMDEQFKEERRKEKRRLQDQLRRLKRNEQKVKTGTPQPPKKPTKPLNPNLAKMRCSACGGTGHMKTNKYCPLYGKRGRGLSEGMGITNTDDEMSQPAPSGELVAVEGTKLKISKKIYQHAEQMKRDSMRVNIPRTIIEKREEEDGDEDMDDEMDMDESMMGMDDDEDDEPMNDSRFSSMGKRRSTWIGEEAEYLTGPSKSVHRMRADPKVTFATQLTDIINELKLVDGSEHLMSAVNGRKIKDYYDIVKKPMDLQKIKMRISNNQYELRMAFLEDVKQMMENSLLYNGPNHVITETARRMFDIAYKKIMEREKEFIRLEKAINPLLDENDRVGFSFILEEILQKCKNIPKSVPFHTKVDARKAAGYYDRISRPMDLGTMEKKVKEYQYQYVKEFLADIQQIYTNSEVYNGPPEKSSYTAKALEIKEMATSLIEEKRGQLDELERNILRRMGIAIDYDDEMSGMSMGEEEREEEMDEDTMMAQDLALSGDDDDEHDDEDEDQFMQMNESQWAKRLEGSSMQMAGQLNADLAMSDSDDDDNVKRPRMDEDLTQF
ncbi:taf-1 [Pristionchus pacificus]|nr:taf-1 [Pristionchus pacificus]